MTKPRPTFLPPESASSSLTARLYLAADCLLIVIGLGLLLGKIFSWY